MKNGPASLSFDVFASAEAELKVTAEASDPSQKRS